MKRMVAIKPFALKFFLNLWKINNMCTKCLIIKLELVDACGRESRVEQTLH
jgi:hypothetical protein